MKNQSTYDTFSTDLAAALRAIGCDMINEDPMRRLFDENYPPNPRVPYGLNRGGRVQYRFKPECDEFDASTASLAQSWANPTHRYNGEEWVPIPEEKTFNAMVGKLREKLSGTEAGRDLEEIIRELPHEIMRYCKLNSQARKENITIIANSVARKDQRAPGDKSTPVLQEFCKVRKEDGHYIIHSQELSPEKVQALLEA